MVVTSYPEADLMEEIVWHIWRVDDRVLPQSNLVDSGQAGNYVEVSKRFRVRLRFMHYVLDKYCRLVGGEVKFDRSGKP